MGFCSVRRIPHYSGRDAVVSRPPVTVDELLGVADREGSVRKREIPSKRLPLTNRLWVDLVLWGPGLAERLVCLVNRQFFGESTPNSDRYSVSCSRIS